MRLVPDDPIADLWPRVVEAFAHYGKRLRSRPGPERTKLIEKRLADGYTPSELLAAIDGYVWSHGGLDREFSNGLTSGHYARPETTWKAEGLDDRVERGLEGGRWRYIDPRERHEQEVKAMQAAARERVRLAREAG